MMTLERLRALGFRCETCVEAKNYDLTAVNSENLREYWEHNICLRYVLSECNYKPRELTFEERCL